MKIKCVPQQESSDGREVETMLGSFLPGEVIEISDDDASSVKIAKKLVENGDFEETDEDPNSEELRTGKPSAVSLPSSSTPEATDSEEDSEAGDESGDESEATAEAPAKKPAARKAGAKKSATKKAAAKAK